VHRFSPILPEWCRHAHPGSCSPILSASLIEANKIETGGMTVGSQPQSKTPTHAGWRFGVAIRIYRSVEEEVEQDQDDCRDTHNPRQEIFTHDVLLSMVCSDDGSIMPRRSGLV
jgi:hypothetical protein